MDPLLAARLARQQEKEQTGESAVEKVGEDRAASSHIDPVLAQRLARQQQKVDAGACSPESTCTDPGSEKKPSPSTPNRMDPVLAKRLARQREKAITGESAVAGLDVGKKVVTQLDPLLAKRLARQQEKVVSGESAVEHVGSKANTSSLLDPLLEKRMTRQLEKVDTGESAVENVASPSRRRDINRGVVDNLLAERLAEQRAKTEDPKVKNERNEDITVSGSPDSKVSDDSCLFDPTDFGEAAYVCTTASVPEGDAGGSARKERRGLGICTAMTAVVVLAIGLVWPLR